ncbi:MULTISPECIES: hypothetical protein [Arthrobacter]|uniref:DUF2127 domain-containing protein n=2 Tax=Arthrobacter TaxID=1663 RepID=A0ABU9KMG8_9MICC|nr:hypothetical protein [Arthrobacter sp. YJM1]MDP5227538.1 hypothetical protein [Arthrobacter sp. YJM1]
MTEQPGTPDHGPDETPQDPQAGPAGPQTPDAGPQRPAPPQYGLRSADLGLPSPYEQYRAREQAERDRHAREQAAHAAQTAWPYRQLPGGGGRGQQPGWGPQPWPGHEAAQFAPMDPPTPMPRPRTLHWAYWLILAAALLGVLGTVWTYTHLDFNALIDQGIRQAEAQTGETLTSSMRDAMVPVTIGALVVVQLISIGLYTMVAVFIRRGRHWARVLGTVFAAISLAGLFSSNLFDAAQVIVGVAAIVLSWMPLSAAYFANAKLVRDHQRFQRFQSHR